MFVFRLKVEKDVKNPSALAELAKAQFELAMLYERAKVTPPSFRACNFRNPEP